MSAPNASQPESPKPNKSEEAKTTDGRAKPLLWRIAIFGVFSGVTSFFLLLLIRAIFAPSWQYSIEATTQAIELTLAPNRVTRWQIDGATLCARHPLENLDEYAKDEDGLCGSSDWHSYAFIDSPEQVLLLNGGAMVSIEALDNRFVGLSLRASRDASDGLGRIAISAVDSEPSLGTAVNIIWPAGAAADRTLPFAAEGTTIGRAVSWSSTRLLQNGNVVVYTADASADRRTSVASASLMLGDQVLLAAPEACRTNDIKAEREGCTWPKGFVRISADGGPLEVVAFGRAESLRIDRFGESGYNFRPGWVARLANDPVVLFWASVLASYMTLVLSIQPFVVSRDIASYRFPLRRLLRRFNVKRPTNNSV
jgi:hypothetical protein